MEYKPFKSFFQTGTSETYERTIQKQILQIDRLTKVHELLSHDFYRKNIAFLTGLVKGAV